MGYSICPYFRPGAVSLASYWLFFLRQQLSLALNRPWANSPSYALLLILFLQSTLPPVNLSTLINPGQGRLHLPTVTATSAPSDVISSISSILSSADASTGAGVTVTGTKSLLPGISSTTGSGPGSTSKSAANAHSKGWSGAGLLFCALIGLEAVVGGVLL